MTNREKAKQLYKRMAKLTTNYPNGTMLSAAGKCYFINWIERQLDSFKP